MEEDLFVDRKPRILLVIDEASVGGGQHHVLWLAEGLVRDGFEVAVACEAKGYLAVELRLARIRHLPIEIDNRMNLRSFLQMLQLVRKFRPDIVHTHGGTAGFYGRIVAHVLRRITVHTYHGIHYLHFDRYWKKRLYLSLDRWLLRWTDAIICVAKSDRQLALDHHLANHGSTFVIVNGIDAGRFKLRRKPKDAKRTAQDKSVIIGAVGRLHEQKGYAYLIEAAVELVKQLPNAEFRVIGEGNLRLELENQVSNFGLQNIFRFLGSRTDIPYQLSQMDVFVLPSLWEGMPFVLMEAMCAGIPIVATNVDGVSEILENEKDALLVPSRDPHSLAKAIVEIVHNRKRAKVYVTNARKKIATKFNITEMVHRTERVYWSTFRS